MASSGRDHVFLEARQLFPDWFEFLFLAGWFLGPMFFAFAICQLVARLVARRDRNATEGLNTQRLIAARKVIVGWQVLIWLTPTSLVAIAFSLGGPLSPIDARASAFVSVVGSYLGMFLSMPGVYKSIGPHPVSFRECFGEFLFAIARMRLVLTFVLVSLAMPAQWSAAVVMYPFAGVALYLIIPRLASSLLRLFCTSYEAPAWVSRAVSAALGASPERSVRICIKTGSAAMLVSGGQVVWLSNRAVENVCESELSSQLNRVRTHDVQGTGRLPQLRYGIALLMPLLIPLSAELPAAPRAYIIMICFGGALLLLLGKGEWAAGMRISATQGQASNCALDNEIGDEAVRGLGLLESSNESLIHGADAEASDLMGRAYALRKDSSRARDGNAPMLPYLVAVLPLCILVASLFAATSRAAKENSSSLEILVAMTGGRMPSSVRALAAQKEQVEDAWASGVLEWAAKELDN